MALSECKVNKDMEGRAYHVGLRTPEDEMGRPM